MRGGRFLFFLISIFLGIVAGLLYGWVLNPRYANTTPDRLRRDYKTDYVLMVAEVYRAEDDVSLASHRLAILSPQPPLRQAQEAIVVAGELGYPKSDLDLMAHLASGLSASPGGAAHPGGTP